MDQNFDGAICKKDLRQFLFLILQIQESDITDPQLDRLFVVKFKNYKKV
jgi:hypothetical protein